MIQLINKLNGLSFNRNDEELVAAFCSQLAVCIENMRALDDMTQAKRLVEAQTARLSGFLVAVRDDFTVDVHEQACRHAHPPQRPRPEHRPQHAAPAPTQRLRP